MLLKGIAEVHESGRPVAAAEMVLVRMAYAADLPTPDEVVRSLSENVSARPQGSGSPAQPESYTARYEAPRRSPRSAAVSPRPTDEPIARAEQPAAMPTLAIGSFEELIALAAEKRDIAVKMATWRAPFVESSPNK